MSNQSGYVRVPRIIRKGYKELTKLQKLLYIYLRDLCGEDGICYRSLRALADETDFSIGYLSENIPALQDVGLILAEKKRHNDKKWEIWHIAVVNIWEQNAAFIKAEKRSSCERIGVERSQDEQNGTDTETNSSHGERFLEESVSTVNTSESDLSLKCSHGANKVSITDNQLQQTNNQSGTYSPTTALSPEEKAFFDLCCSLIVDGVQVYAIPPQLTDKNCGHIAKLAEHIKTAEDLERLYRLTKKRMKGFSNQEVYLGNLEKSLNAWLQTRPVATSNFSTPEGDGTVLWCRFTGNNGKMYRQDEALARFVEFERMPVAEAARYEYSYGAYPGEVLARIDDLLIRLEEGEIDREGNPIQQLAYA